MKKIEYKKINRLYWCLLTFLLSAFPSCKNEEIQPEKDIDSPLYFSSSISSLLSTRAYQSSGNILEGKYYLTYPTGLHDQEYCVSTVNFVEGTGFVTTPEGDELTWKKVGYDYGSLTSTTFFLDNVPVQNSFSETIIILPEDNPFKAGIFDSENGSNDLLWGNTITDRLNNLVHISLHHQMAMVNIELSIDNSKEGSLPLDLSEAKVEITDLVLSSQSYDRLNGVLFLGDQPKYANLNLKDEFSNWKEIEYLEDNRDKPLFKSHDFVLPPQSLKTGIERPRLIITIPQNEGKEPRVFSGILPQAMLVETSENTSVAMNLSFLKEHILTLHVTMDPDLMNLQFMPVTVIDWVYKGTFLANGTQAALFSESDFMAMIKAYNDNSNDIERYGYQKDGEWWFNIYSDLTFKEDDLFGKMKGKNGKEIHFKFNGQTITILLKDGNELAINDDNKNSHKLNRLLNGENSWND